VGISLALLIVVWLLDGPQCKKAKWRRDHGRSEAARASVGPPSGQISSRRKSGGPSLIPRRASLGRKASLPLPAK
jgi:hypothetical protein